MVGTDDGWEVRAAPDGDGLTIAGYIAKFNERTNISDFFGDYVEQIKPGAFTRTLADRAGKVKMQFNHGHDATFGTLPIGVWTSLREDRKGLWAEGRIHDNWHTLPIRAAIESGALDGMSFRFKAIAEEWRAAADEQSLDERTLTEVALFEAGPVVNPAYEGTTVGVRMAALDMLRGLDPSHYDPVRSLCTTLVVDQPVAPVGDSGPARAEADAPVGITRRDMRQQALSRLGAMP